MNYSGSPAAVRVQYALSAAFARFVCMGYRKSGQIHILKRKFSAKVIQISDISKDFGEKVVAAAVSASVAAENVARVDFVGDVIQHRLIAVGDDRL